jgi:hypothetical protein
MTNNILQQWVDLNHGELESLGLRVSFPSAGNERCTSVNIDSASFVGTICFWPINMFEFQFNDCKTGDVIVIETAELDSVEVLDTHFRQLWQDKLST